MAKLPRVTSKIFASNAAEGDIGQFGSALTGTKVPTDDISIIQALPAYETGWRGAVVSDRNYPTLQEMNGLQKTFSQQIAYILQNGMPEWDAGTTYYTDQFCRVGSMFYVSLQDENTGNNPTSTTGYWEIWNPAEGTYANTDLSNLSPTGQNKLDSKLSDTQVTNCILSSTNANITNNSVSDASYVNQGCTVSESNVVSGFSANNYILLSKTMTSANAFTLEIPFTTGSNVNADQTLVYINNFSNSLGISGGKIALRYDGNVRTGTTTLAASTAYVALLTRTASNYTVQIKTASGAYGDAEITLPSTAGYFGGKSVYLGGGDANYFQGTIDLANVVITSNSADYWRITTLSDFQTVTVSGTYQLLMPDGRNSDRTMKNVTSTITLNDTLLYSPANGEKTLLVKEDGEVMIRDTYEESYTEPADFATGGVFFNKTENTLNEQLSTYPNFLNIGNATVNNVGHVTGFGANTYLELPSTYTLGNGSWEFQWSANYNRALSAAVNPIVHTPVGESGHFKAFEVTQEGTTLTAKFRRPDVYIVNREITVSTAYEVSKTVTTGGSDDEETTTVTGYVQTQGEAESYVTAGTQVYSDSGFQTPLEQAAADTWTYTGDSVANTEVQTGYTKVGGVTLVPADTVVYSDANCTSVQATASGTDYTYTQDMAESIICTLSETIGGDSYITNKIGFDGANYYLDEETYASTDTVQDNIQIMLGSDGISGDSSLWIALSTTQLTAANNIAWDWNGVSSSTEDFVSFVGAKIGDITDNGTTITSMTIDMPLTLAKDTDVVHNTGNENIEGVKSFKNIIILDNNNGVNYPSIYLKQSQADYTTTSGSFYGGRFLSLDKNGNWFGAVQSLQISSGTRYTELLTRRILDGENKQASMGVYINAAGDMYAQAPTYTGNYADNSSKIVTTAYMANHWVTSKPTTTSSASKARPAVVIQNYVSGTSWYRVWSDGFIEQGGRTTSGTTVAVTFLKKFANTNYTISVQDINNTFIEGAKPNNMTASGFQALFRYSVAMSWYACGY